MRRWGRGLFSLALGIAVQVSGVKGLVAAEVAWTAVIVGLALLVVSWMRGQGDTSRPERRKRRKPPLDRALQHLGREILAFVYVRDAEAPGWESSESTLRHPVRASRIWRALRAHEQDTMSMYRQKFTSDVRKLVREMVDVHVGRNEARHLLNPRNVLEVEAIGQRLVEIGEAIGSPRKTRAA